MGFLPGLGYMTGVDEALYLPRRSEPWHLLRKGRWVLPWTRPLSIRLIHLVAGT